MYDENKYQTDNALLAVEMQKAAAAEQCMNDARARALEIHAKEEAQKAAIARQVDLSVSQNQQLIHRQAFGNRVVRSQDVGAYTNAAAVECSVLTLESGMQVSVQQARELVQYGNLSQRDFDRALKDSLTSRGFR